MPTCAQSPWYCYVFKLVGHLVNQVESWYLEPMRIEHVHPLKTKNMILSLVLRLERRNDNF